MHIGFAGPISLAPLADRLGDGLPGTYSVTYTGQLVRTWLEQGHRVTVYALSEEVAERRVKVAGPLTAVLVPMRLRARHYMRDFFRTERSALVSAMHDHPADVVSAHWTYEFALAAARSGRPSFVTAHDAPLRCAWAEGAHPYRWLRNAQAVPAVHRADALSGVSPYTARHLRQVLRAPREVRVIPNGVRLADLPAAPRPRATDEPVFATVLNGWGPLKNGEAALSAFGLARTLIPRARLLMFGSGFEVDGPAAAWAGRRGLAAGVEFVGPTGHAELLARIAREVTVVVHPSRLEACPMALLEVMGIGVPVIGGRRSGGVPWVLGDGTAGMLVDVGSPRRIADAMLRLALDENLRARFAATGRTRVRRDFDLENVAADYVRWFESAEI
jgi:glycosyltransferase involved in cell wall biosynthesis